VLTLARTHARTHARTQHTHTHSHTHTHTHDRLLYLHHVAEGFRSGEARWSVHGESAEREPIAGIWGLCLQRGPEAEPLIRGSGDPAPGPLKLIRPWRCKRGATFAHLLFASCPFRKTA